MRSTTSINSWRLNGFQATRLLTRGAQTRHIPVVMVSNKDQQTDRVWGARQGARGYVTKPVRDRSADP